MVDSAIQPSARPAAFCRLGVALCIVLIMLTAQAGPALHNRLASHPSPYLAMHGADPVAWQDWGTDAVALAREQGKLLFISSGYFSCHWCHVMQRESYQDDGIAALLNKHFVPIKLDRELHSALDAYLIAFVEKTQGQAGWPLNVFLTPEGYPLIGATYLPAQQFRTLLERLARTWEDERGRMRNLARRTLLQLTLEEPPVQVEAMPPAMLREALLRQALSLADTMEGGFGDQSRFPMTPQLAALLELQSAAPHPALADFLQLTLDKMAGEGLRDHLAGGFFRYTVDPSWQVPHFEKMLYTQAQVATIYLRAAEVLQRADYRDVARDTLLFVAREMRGTQGGYVASFSAVDGKGEEGGVYLWTIDQLHELLGESDTALARRHWRMFDYPALDGGHLPRRGETAPQIAAALDAPTDQIEARLLRIRNRLSEARAQRVLPVDNKELAGWNGLMLAAFARGAAVLDEPLLRDAAQRVRGFLRDTLWDGKRLRRALADGREVGRASLEDYAYVAYGMQEYTDSVANQPVDRTFVTALLHLAFRDHLGASGWRMDDRPLIPGMAEEAAQAEGALPAPAALIIRLALGSDSAELRAKAASAAQLSRQQAQAEPFWYAGHHAALLAVAPDMP